jgi:drug/metabolite transporter (DMT)-like permease
MRRGVASGSALNGLYLTLLPGVPLFWLAAWATGQIFELDQLDGGDLLFLVGAGLTHFMVGRYCTLRAMAALGANRASPVIVSSVLVSVGAAILFLGESVTAVMALGTALVIVGPGFAASSPKRGAAVPASGGNPAASKTLSFDDLPRDRLVRGYAWAVVNALAFGTSPLLIKAALGDSGLGVLGGAIAYTSAGIPLALILLLPGQVASLRAVDKNTRTWFLVAAVTIMVAQMFRFLGISHTDVSIAVPLLRGGQVFAYVMAFFVNRHLESFNRRVLIGTAVAILGSIALVI